MSWYLCIIHTGVFFPGFFKVLLQLFQSSFIAVLKNLVNVLELVMGYINIGQISKNTICLGNIPVYLKLGRTSSSWQRPWSRPSWDFRAS